MDGRSMESDGESDPPTSRKTVGVVTGAGPDVVERQADAQTFKVGENMSSTTTLMSPEETRG